MRRGLEKTKTLQLMGSIVKWARKIDDNFAEVWHKDPGRFHACALLSYQHIYEALKEIDRTYEKLGVNPVRKEGAF